MKKNFRVVKFNGFNGIFLIIFAISCLIAGFIAFPAFLTMYIWNYLALKTLSFPAINFGQGLLLWAIIIFSCYIFNKKKFVISFNTQHELTDEEVRDVVSRIKTQAFNQKLLQPKDLNIKEKDEVKEIEPQEK